MDLCLLGQVLVWKLGRPEPYSLLCLQVPGCPVPLSGFQGSSVGPQLSSRHSSNLSGFNKKVRLLPEKEFKSHQESVIGNLKLKGHTCHLNQRREASKEMRGGRHGAGRDWKARLAS